MELNLNWPIRNSRPSHRLVKTHPSHKLKRKQNRSGIDGFEKSGDSVYIKSDSARFSESDPVIIGFGLNKLKEIGSEIGFKGVSNVIGSRSLEVFEIVDDDDDGTDNVDGDNVDGDNDGDDSDDNDGDNGDNDGDGDNASESDNSDKYDNYDVDGFKTVNVKSGFNEGNDVFEEVNVMNDVLEDGNVMSNDVFEGDVMSNDVFEGDVMSNDVFEGDVMSNDDFVEGIDFKAKYGHDGENGEDNDGAEVTLTNHKTSGYGISGFNNDSDTISLTHIEDSEEEPTELVSDLVDVNFTLNTSILEKWPENIGKDSSKVTINVLNESSRANSYKCTTSSAIASSPLISSQNISKVDLTASKNIPSSSRNDCTYTSNAEEVSYTDNIRSNDLTANLEGLPEELIHSDNIRINDLTTCVEEDEKEFVDLIENRNVDVPEKTISVELSNSKTQKKRKRVNANGSFQPSSESSIESFRIEDSSKIESDQTISPSTSYSSSVKVKPSLADLCKRTNVARNRHIVGLSRKSRIDSLHKISR